MLQRAFRSISIRSKILLLVSLPLFFLTAVSVFQIYELAKRTKFDTALTQDVMLTVGSLVHDLQLERGMTAGFLASKEQKTPPQKLVEQRALVDQKSKHMFEIFDMIDLNTLHGTSREFVIQAHHEMQEIRDVRERIDTGEVTAKQAIGFYTALNTHLLETALALEILIPNAELAERAMAMTYFMMAKDAYGLQRAAGAIGFTEGWNTANVVRLVRSTDQAEERLRVFHELSDEESYGLYQAHKNTETYQEFKTIRDAVLAGGAIPYMHPKAWFELATNKIVGIKKVEDQIVAIMNDEFDAFDRGNRNALIQASVGFAALMIAVLYISAQLIKDMNQGLKRLSSALEEIGGNKLDVPVPGQNRVDEVGQIAREVEALRKGALEKREADRVFTRTVKEQEFVQSEIGTALTQLQSKSLDYRIDQDFPEAFLTLRQDFNALASELDDAMQVVRETGLNVSEGAMSINANVSDLSSRTESQANALERSTEALREITDSVTSSAQHASDAEQLSIQTQGEVDECATVVGETTEAMRAIEASSEEISQIAKVIEEIAFQTNLLALNAGVEAARAGDAGRGFAVVAGEVQSLAQRCSTAVAQIEDLTSRSAREVKRGSELASTAGEAMNRVNGQVSEVSTLIKGISQSLGGQSSQLSEINVAVGEMESMTQRNVAMVEETSAASQSLYGLASQLTNLIAEFRLGDGSGTRQSTTRFAA